MPLESLFPHLAGWQIDAVTIASDITLALTPTQRTATCPACGQVSRRVHSRYVRTLADLPVAGRAVTLCLRVRRFFCDITRCSRTIFCERLPNLALAHARRTTPLQADLRRVGAALGGRPGAVLAGRLAMPASRMTLLRLVHAAVAPAQPTPRVLGIDDWAWRKGRVYGTIRVDLERRRPIDLLPERTADALADWLMWHPGVEVISRDRDSALAEGARRGAPDAIQAADRWHLAKNLAEALLRILDRHAPTLRETAEAIARERAKPAPPVDDRDDGALAVVERAAPTREEPHAVADRERRREKRLARYDEVLALHRAGVSLREIARRTGLARETVRRYANAAGFPEIKCRARRQTRLNAHLPFLLERWNDGCHDGAVLWRDLRERGYTGSRSAMARYLTRLRRAQGLPPRSRRPASDAPRAVAVEYGSPRQAVWLFLRRPDDLDEADRAYLGRLRRACAELDRAYTLAQGFMRLIRERRGDELEAWAEDAGKAAVAELCAFADGLRSDWAAVQAGLTLPWSQGPVEGHVNRLKTLKRQGYGRQSFDLLRQRVLDTG